MRLWVGGTGSEEVQKFMGVFLWLEVFKSPGRYNLVGGVWLPVTRSLWRSD